MVLKSKGGKQSRSVKAGKNSKGGIKYYRKHNYKKSSKTYEDCSICYNSVEKIKDNTIQCQKKVHVVCYECKGKLLDKDCPMCRSHTITRTFLYDLIVHTQGSRLSNKPRKQDPMAREYRVGVGSERRGEYYRC